MSSKNPPTSNNTARRFTTNDNNGEGSFRGGFDFGFIFGLRKNNNSNDIVRKEKALLSPDQKISKVKDAKVNDTNSMSNPTSGVVQNIQKKKEERKKPIKKKEPEFLTLSVHEDTTFNGVGIVFHPKFSQKNKKSEKNQQQVTHNNDNGINYHNQINSFSNPYNSNLPLHFQRQQHHNVPSGNFQQRSQFQCRFQNHYNININTTNNFNTIQNNSYINNYNSNISVGMETKSEEEEEEEDYDDDLLKPGDLVQIYVWDVNDDSNIKSNDSPPQTRVERKRNNYKLRTSFVIRTTEESLDNIKENARTQISIRRKVADLYNLSSFDVLSFSRVQFENDAATTNADTDDDEDDEEEDTINDDVSTDSNKIKKKVPLSTFDSTSTKRDEEELQFLKSTKSYADFITLTFKDRFISRGEMFQLQNSLVGQWMFEGERIVTENVSSYNLFSFHTQSMFVFLTIWTSLRYLLLITVQNKQLQANAYKIRDENSAIKSGIVTKESKITFRSGSARIIWLVQIATEMWEYTNPNSGICGIYFDKYVQFIKKLFNKWKELDVSHSLTVVFFSRTFVYNNNSNNPTSSTLKMDIDGRYFEDNYKVVIENETRADWDSLVYIIKKEFLLYPKQVGWSIMNGAGIGTSVPTSTESSFDPVSSQQQNTTNCIRLPSIASQGNILEAINVALNMLQLHYMDRDLYRTGNSLVVVTPGCGVFEVNKDLASITKQRMMDNGIGSDMLSLSLPPLHIAPFFLYKENRSVVKDDGDDDWKTYFEIPHWMHLSFTSYDDNDRKSVSKTISVKDQKTSTSTKINSSEHSVINKSKAQQRHLISGREFDDILEACRPRNRIDISTRVVSSLPSALLSIVSSSPSGAYNSNSTKQPSNTSSAMDSSIITPATTLTSSGRLLLNPPSLWKKQTNNQPHHPDILSPSNQQQQSQSMNITEWGRINLDDMRTINNTPNNVGATNTVSSANLQTSNNQMAQFVPSSPGNSNTNTNGPNSMKRHSFQESGSDASPSPSSSFNSTYSYLLSRSAATASGYSPSSTSHKFVPFSSHHTSTEIQPIQSYEDNTYRNFMLAGSEAGDAMTSSTHHTATTATTTNYNATKFPKSDNSIDSILSTHSIHGDEPSPCTNDLKSFMMKYDSNVWKAHEKKKPEKKKSITIPDQQQSEYSKNTSSLDRSTHSLIGRGPNQANMKPSLSHNALERGSVHGNRSGRIKSLSNLMENSNLGNSNNNKATPKLTNYNKVQKQGGIGAALGQFNKTVATNNTKKKSHRSSKKSNKKNNTTSNTKNNKLSPPLRPQISASNNMSPSFLGPPAIMAVASPPNLRQVIHTDNSKNNNMNDKLLQHSTHFININGNSNSYGNGYGNYQIIGSNHSLEINRHHYQVQAQNKKLNASYHGFTKKSTTSYHQTKNAKGNKERKNSKKNIALLSKQLHYPSRSSLKQSSNYYAQHNNYSQQSRRKRRVLNPFREQDEEDVLAKRTHNRRRWSHVFPKGEVEFKRHAGPNWTSLCQVRRFTKKISFVLLFTMFFDLTLSNLISNIHLL